MEESIPDWRVRTANQAHAGGGVPQLNSSIHVGRPFGQTRRHGCPASTYLHLLAPQATSTRLTAAAGRAPASRIKKNISCLMFVTTKTKTSACQIQIQIHPHTHTHTHTYTPVAFSFCGCPPPPCADACGSSSATRPRAASSTRAGGGGGGGAAPPSADRASFPLESRTADLTRLPLPETSPPPPPPPPRSALARGHACMRLFVRSFISRVEASLETAVEQRHLLYRFVLTCAREASGAVRCCAVRWPAKNRYFESLHEEDGRHPYRTDA